MSNRRSASLALRRILPWLAFKKPSTLMLETFSDAVKTGQMTIQLPNGSTHSLGRHPIDAEGREHRGVMKIKSWSMVRKSLMGGDVGFAEAYMDGDWDSPDLTALLTMLCLNEVEGSARWQASGPFRLYHHLQHRRRANTKRGSRRNIAAHYDLGNAFYTQWLDPTMSYSAAVFSDDTQPLKEAQDAKLRRVCETLDLKPGMTLLEIGCGWGGLAEMAARDFGVHVTGITLSTEQAAFARERAKRAGLEDRIDIRLQDYRDLDGRFDRIASIEMFEAVGEENWPTYFETLSRHLKPGGLAQLQIITIAEDRFPVYREGADFIQRYIFPGGMLPPPGRVVAGAAAHGLELEDDFVFGRDYAKTLNHWQQTFQHNWPAIKALGFDDRFKRMWEYYLAYCEAGFLTGACDVHQYLLRKA
ncbi:MAG: class I SAM-dependent methyltransferase [Magnetovibrionaceae bacterium]